MKRTPKREYKPPEKVGSKHHPEKRGIYTPTRSPKMVTKPPKATARKASADIDGAEGGTEEEATGIWKTHQRSR